MMIVNYNKNVSNLIEIDIRTIMDNNYVKQIILNWRQLIYEVILYYSA